MKSVQVTLGSRSLGIRATWQTARVADRAPPSVSEASSWAPPAPAGPSHFLWEFSVEQFPPTTGPLAHGQLDMVVGCQGTPSRRCSTTGVQWPPLKLQSRPLVLSSEPTDLGPNGPTWFQWHADETDRVLDAREMHYLSTDCRLQLGVTCLVQQNIWEEIFNQTQK